MLIIRYITWWIKKVIIEIEEKNFKLFTIRKNNCVVK